MQEKQALLSTQDNVFRNRVVTQDNVFQNRVVTQDSVRSAVISSV